MCGILQSRKHYKLIPQFRRYRLSDFMFFFLNVDSRNVDVFSANLIYIERFFLYRVNNIGLGE